MPRIKQNFECYAKEDFLKEIRCRQGEHDLMSVRALASAAGIAHTTLHEKLREPDRLTVADLKKLTATIRPNPFVVLALLGYKLDKKEKGEISPPSE